MTETMRNDIWTALECWTGETLPYGEYRAVAVRDLLAVTGRDGFDDAALSLIREGLIGAVWSDVPAAASVTAGNGYFATHLYVA